MKKKIFLLILLCLSVTAAVRADTLTLESGEVINGQITEQTDEFIRITVAGRERLYLAYEIVRLNGESYMSPVVSNYQELSSGIHDASLETDGARGSVSVIGPAPQESGRSVFGEDIEKQVQKLKMRSPRTCSLSGIRGVDDLVKIWPLLVIVFILSLALGYVYPGYCLMRIAQKTAVEPAWIAWIPVANVFLMCKIGGVNYLWLLGCFVLFIPLIGPLLFIGIIVYIWYNICLARNKPGWLGFVTILPLGYWIVLGILAFTNGEGAQMGKTGRTDLEVRVERPGEMELNNRGVFSWPVWEKEVSRFDWHYDQTEQCYLLEGEAVVEYGDGKKVLFGKGDFIVFPKGLSCVWEIKKAVKKHYNFS